MTFAPLISGDVSTCAMKPIAGTAGLRRRRRDRRHHVAVLVERGIGEPERLQFRDESRAGSTSCVAVLGTVVELSSDCVSYRT